MVRSVAKLIIHAYRKVISPISPGNCRYYPSCSEYALIQFDTRPWWIAFPMSLIRILRCNQLFEGGFDYPKMAWTEDVRPLAPGKNVTLSETAFFLVPDGKGKVEIIRKMKENQ